jgi:hypothetical protein
LTHQVEQLSEFLDKEKMRRIRNRSVHTSQEFPVQQTPAAITSSPPPKNLPTSHTKVSPTKGIVESKSRVFSPSTRL